jgi:hypothetical protein
MSGLRRLIWLTFSHSRVMETFRKNSKKCWISHPKRLLKIHESETAIGDRILVKNQIALIKMKKLKKKNKYI